MIVLARVGFTTGSTLFSLAMFLGAAAAGYCAYKEVRKILAAYKANAEAPARPTYSPAPVDPTYTENNTLHYGFIDPTPIRTQPVPSYPTQQDPVTVVTHDNTAGNIIAGVALGAALSAAVDIEVPAALPREESRQEPDSEVPQALPPITSEELEAQIAQEEPEALTFTGEPLEPARDIFGLPVSEPVYTPEPAPAPEPVRYEPPAPEPERYDPPSSTDYGSSSNDTGWSSND